MASSSLVPARFRRRLRRARWSRRNYYPVRGLSNTEQGGGGGSPRYPGFHLPHLARFTTGCPRSSRWRADRGAAGRRALDPVEQLGRERRNVGERQAVDVARSCRWRKEGDIGEVHLVALIDEAGRVQQQLVQPSDDGRRR